MHGGEQGQGEYISFFNVFLIERTVADRVQGRGLKPKRVRVKKCPGPRRLVSETSTAFRTGHACPSSCLLSPVTKPAADDST